MKHSKQKKPGFFDKVILALNLLFAVALLLSYLAPVTDPRNYPLIAVLGFGYQVLVLVNLLFAGYWLLRSWQYALLSLLCIVAGFSILASNFGFRAASPVAAVKQPGAIRLMQYNVRGFRGIGRYENDPTYTEILALIKKEQPDVIAFEEYTLRSGDSISITDSIKKALGTTYAYYKAFAGNKDVSSGVALFSKLQVAGSGYITSPPALQTRAIFIDVRYKGRIVRVYAVHLAAVDIRSDDKTRILNGGVDLGNTTFIKSKLTSAFIARSHQVAYIKDGVDSCTYPHIICGDFNDTPLSYAVNTLGDGLINAFAAKGSGLGVTYYSRFPKLQIDYILASPVFNVLNYEALDQEISDHKPVISDLIFK